MGVVRVDDKLLVEIKQWLSKNGNRYECPNVASFVNKSIYKLLRDFGVRENEKGK